MIENSLAKFVAIAPPHLTDMLHRFPASPGIETAMEIGYPEGLPARLDEICRRDERAFWLVHLAALGVAASAYGIANELAVGIAKRDSQAGLSGQRICLLKIEVPKSGTFRDYLNRLSPEVEAAFESNELGADPLRHTISSLSMENAGPSIAFLLSEGTAEEGDAFMFPAAIRIRILRRDRKATLMVGVSADPIFGDFVSFFGENFLSVLATLTDDPDANLKNCLNLGPAELTALKLLRGPKIPIPMEATPASLFLAQLRKAPLKTALLSCRGSFTYRDLDRESEKVKKCITARGAGRGKIIGICGRRSEKAVIACLGVAKAGAAYLLISPETPTERRTMMLNQARADIFLAIEPMQGLSDMVAVVEWETIMREDAPTVDCEPSGTPHDLAYVMFTSGTTGEPKPVAITNRNLVNKIWTHNTVIPLSAADRCMVTSSVMFDPFVEQVWYPLCNGTEVAILDEGEAESPLKVAETISNWGITCFSSIPFTLGSILNDIPGKIRLKTLIVGGDVFSPTLYAKVREKIDCGRVLNIYGPTETTVSTTFHLMRDQDSSIPAPIGRPMANYDIWILDDRLKPVPKYGIGELCIGGLGVGNGYLGLAGASSEKFTEFPPSSETRIYRTGDLAYWSPDGEVIFVGRIDNQVKIRGARVNCEEIQLAMRSCFGVLEAAVFTMAGADGNMELVALIKLTSEGASKGIGRYEIRSEMIKRNHLYQVPSKILIIEDVPLTVSGKLDKKAAMEWVKAAGAAISTGTAPESEVQRKISGYWSGLTGYSDFGIDADLFDWGAQSLNLMRLSAYIEGELGTRLELRDLLEAPTIRSIAELIRSREAVA